jgi:hypothetical protein
VHLIAILLGLLTIGYSLYINKIFSKKRAIIVINTTKRSIDQVNPITIFTGFMIRRLSAGELTQLVGLGLVLFQLIANDVLTATDIKIYLILLGVALSIKRYSKPKKEDLIVLVNNFRNRYNLPKLR